MVHDSNTCTDRKQHVTEANLTALLRLLAETRERAARSGNADLVTALDEAAKISATSHTVCAASNIDLQAALVLLRTGRAGDAAPRIERAAQLCNRWVAP